MLATWSTGQGRPGLHVKVGKALYSVPWRLIGQQVDARATATTVQVLHDGRGRRHPRPSRNGARRTDFDALPAGEDRVPHADPGLVPAAGRDDRPACQAVIGDLLDGQRPVPAPRRPGRPRPAPTSTATAGSRPPARPALAAGDPSYRTVKGILAAGTETPPAPTPAATGGRSGTAAGVPAFLRGPGELVRLNPSRAAAGPAGDEPVRINVVRRPTTSADDDRDHDQARPDHRRD